MDRLEAHHILGEIAHERYRQVFEENNPPEKDDGYRRGQLPLAAAVYTLQASYPAVAAAAQCDPAYRGVISMLLKVVHVFWPWDWRFYKPKDPRRDLIRAAALIVAEIERLDRAAACG